MIEWIDSLILGNLKQICNKYCVHSWRSVRVVLPCVNYVLEVLGDVSIWVGCQLFYDLETPCQRAVALHVLYPLRHPYRVVYEVIGWLLTLVGVVGNCAVVHNHELFHQVAAQLDIRIHDTHQIRRLHAGVHLLPQ